MSSWKHKRKVKKKYEITAEIYDSRYAEEQTAKYQAALANMAPTEIALDVGCGTGLLFNQIAAKTKSAIGVDLSRKLLLKAKQRAALFCNIDLVQADADYLPFKNDKFDAVFAFTILQNMPEPSKTLREITRIAREGAKVVITGLKKVFQTGSLKKLVGEAGLRILSVDESEGLKCYIIFCRK